MLAFYTNLCIQTKNWGLYRPLNFCSEVECIRCTTIVLALIGPTKPSGSLIKYIFEVGWVAGLRRLMARSANWLLLEGRLMEQLIMS